MDMEHQFIHTLLRFRRTGLAFPARLNISMGEYIVMKRISENIPLSGNVNVSDIQCNSHFTKPAVSQILNALEKKGYITREIDNKDRRKIAVSITPKGSGALKAAKEYADKMLEKIMSYFGEENIQRLIGLLNLLTDAIEKVESENKTNNEKGESQLG